MVKLLFVGFGGFCGSVCRYLASGLAYRIAGSSSFPYGTFAVNIIGCFLIGLLNGIAEDRFLVPPQLRLFTFVGFLGGFTTFSTFEYEMFTFAQEGDVLTSLLSLILHIIVGFGAVWLGHIVSRFV